MLMKDFVVIKTDRLILRRLEKTDAADFFAYRAMPEVCRFQSFRPAHVRDADAFIAALAEYPDNAAAWFQIAVCLADTGVLIGDIGMHFLNKGVVEIGYTLNPRFQKHGYAHEAVCAVVGYLFDDLKKMKIIAVVDRENAASTVLLKKLGMRKCAREAIDHTDINESEDVYALSAERQEER